MNYEDNAALARGKARCQASLDGAAQRRWRLEHAARRAAGSARQQPQDTMRRWQQKRMHGQLESRRRETITWTPRIAPADFQDHQAAVLNVSTACRDTIRRAMTPHRGRPGLAPALPQACRDHRSARRAMA